MRGFVWRLYILAHFVSKIVPFIVVELVLSDRDQIWSEGDRATCEEKWLVIFFGSLKGRRRRERAREI
jgi:hypothetical protein